MISATTETGAQRGVQLGVGFAAFTPGVHKCWRGDITQPNGKAAFWSNDRQSQYLQPCSGAKEWYAYLEYPQPVNPFLTH